MAEDDSEESAVTIDHDVTNEMIVVAAALVDEDIREEQVPKLQADKFIDPDHALIWSAMQRILKRKKGFDLQQLHKEVAGKVRLQYLKQLMETYPEPPVDLDQHLAALHWDSTRARATEDSIPDFLRALKDNTESPAKVHALADRVAKSLKAKADRSFMHDPRLLAADQRIAMEKRANIACYEYGIKELDYYPDGRHRCVPGAAPGKITNITAVSGSGKSVLAAYIALEQARRGRKVLYGAWEMGSKDTIEALAIISFQTDYPELASRYAASTGDLTADELDMFQARMAKIGEYIKFFDPPFHDEPWRKYTNEDSLAELHRMIVDSGCEVTIYDLFERCLPDGAPGPERRALFGLQQIHIITETHGLMCTQQKLKEVEKRPDKRPTRDLILGSQAWVDISDTIIGVHRAALWKSIPDDSAELLLLKQRYGKWPQAILMDWDGDRMTFANGRDVDFEHAGGKEGSLF